MDCSTKWSTAVGSGAAQTTILVSHRISGNGWADVGFTGDNSASSLFSVVFQVDATDQYSLSGLFTDVIDENSITLSSSSMMGESIFSRNGFADIGPWVENFMLVAGETYTLVAISSGSDFSGTPDTGQWEFTMVPEPSTGLLVLLGLIGLAGGRRSRG